MAKGRTHLRDEQRSGILDAGVCGSLGGLTTVEPGSVTCRRCLRAMMAVADAVVVAVIESTGQTEVDAFGERIIERSIRGEEPERCRWSSVRAALGAWADWRDRGVPLASSSNPDRFGRGAMGDGGGRMSLGSDDLLDVEAVFERACVAMHIGGMDVPARLVRAVAEARLCGRPVSSRIPGRKGMRQDRVPVSVADVVQSSGLSSGIVAAIVRRVYAAVSSALGGKGLVPVARLEVRRWDPTRKLKNAG